MRCTRGWRFAVAAVICVPAVWASAPRVADVTPPSGATGVPTDIGELVIVFDQPMHMSTWFITAVAGYPLPPQFDAESAIWIDPTTFMLMLDDLRPNTKYAVQLNGSRRSGFIAAEEEVPLEVTQLFFTTGESDGRDNPPAATARARPASAALGPTVFRRVTEEREQAFSMLVPEGWQTEGGVLRIDPTAGGGAAQSIEAKVDFAAKSDAQGTVMLQRLPDWYFCDMRHSPAGQMGLYPPGSNYGGMTVHPVMSPGQFIREVVVPQYHPQARNVRVREERALPKVARSYAERMGAMFGALGFTFDAALLTITYSENGTHYKERVFTLIENRGPAVAGQWVNRETVYVRAPEKEFDRWEPVFSLMHGSVKLNPEWLAREMRGALTRAGVMDRVHREIHNDMFLTLTGREEYINPHTQEIEAGPSELGYYRWETAQGDVIYTDNETYDPNPEGLLGRTDWKRSPVRPRSPR